MERGHGYFRRKGVFGGLFLVDLDAEAGRSGRLGEAFFEHEGICDYIIAPGNVVADHLLNQIIRRGETDVQRGCCADWSSGIVASDRDLIRFSHGCDAPRFADAAAVGNVGLHYGAGALFKQFTELPAASQTLTGGDGKGQRARHFD